MTDEDRDEARASCFVDHAAEFRASVEALWKRTNMSWSHPLDLENVWRSLRESLEASKASESYSPDKPYGVGLRGQYDGDLSMATGWNTVTHVLAFVVTLGPEPSATVTVAIGKTVGKPAYDDAGLFWPELKHTTAVWSDHCPKLHAWATTAAPDRLSTTRAVAEQALAANAPTLVVNQVTVAAPTTFTSEDA